MNTPRVARVSWLELLREAAASLRAHPVPTFLVAAIVGAMVVTTLLTVGRADAAQAQVADALESAGARRSVITDVRANGLLTPLVIDQIGALNVVERAVGLGTATDMVNAAFGDGGTRVTAWTVTGDLDSIATLASGRLPESGEALVSRSALTALGLQHPVGAVRVPGHSTSVPVVGTYIPREPFAEIDGILVSTPAADAHTMTVIATSAAQAATAMNTALLIIAPSDPTELSVTSPATVAELQQSIVGSLAGFGQGLLVLVLVSGAVLVAIVVLADTLIRRSDLGRRRALGASRPIVIALVVTRTLLAAAIGAILGAFAGIAALTLGGVEPPRMTFTIAVAILAVLASLPAAVAPALIAAYQDPVGVLRTA